MAAMPTQVSCPGARLPSCSSGRGQRPPGPALFPEVSTVVLVHLLEAGPARCGPLRPEVTPLVSPGRAASHTRSTAHGALIWQAADAHLECLLLLHIHTPVLQAAGGAGILGLWSAQPRLPLCWGGRNESTSRDSPGLSCRRRHAAPLSSRRAACWGSLFASLLLQSRKESVGFGGLKSVRRDFLCS